MENSDPVQQRLAHIVASAPVVLFMKGNRRQPQCGFSATVVSILDQLLPDYETVNVLADHSVREGVKVFSSWPTIPQLYVKGEFIGGCDIVREMFDSGELHKALGVEERVVVPPSITVSERARAMFAEALKDGEPDEVIKVQISPAYQTGLGIERRGARDVIVELDGLTLAFDPISAQRAEGMSIDFIDQAGGQAGFKIDNPNAPPSVQQLSVEDLKAKLDGGEKVELFDVRTPREREVATIPGAVMLDDNAEAYIQQLDKSTPLVFHCHHGGRSQRAAEYFLSQGYTKVFNVIGGIDAWSLRVDSSVPRY
ncbi:MAG: Grx4 family monothiol glutaredoxin [Myxococcales bacterium]|nr:Grx4 family monothiol glutaredoxin [Myxococcales bacterium]